MQAVALHHVKSNRKKAVHHVKFSWLTLEAEIAWPKLNDEPSYAEKAELCHRKDSLDLQQLLEKTHQLQSS